MYCLVFVVGHFVWEYEGVSREWRTELYVLLCVGSWTFCVREWGGLQGWRTELYVLLCVSSWTSCVGVWGFSSNWRTEMYVLMCVGSLTLCVGMWRGHRVWRTEFYILLCVGISTFFVGVWGVQQDVTYWIEMYCCVFAFGHFVCECGDVKRKWLTEMKFTAVVL